MEKYKETTDLKKYRKGQKKKKKEIPLHFFRENGLIPGY